MGDKSLNLIFQVTKPSEGLEKGFNLRSLRGPYKAFQAGDLCTPLPPSVSPLLMSSEALAKLPTGSNLHRQPSPEVLWSLLQCYTVK